MFLKIKICVSVLVMFAMTFWVSAVNHFYLPQTKFLGQGNIFTGVCLSTGGVIPDRDPPWTETPRQRPPDRDPPDRDSPDRDPRTETPRVETPQTETPPDRPPGQRPPRQRPPQTESGRYALPSIRLK